jgi:hypothetical protein
MVFSNEKVRKVIRVEMTRTFSTQRHSLDFSTQLRNLQKQKNLKFGFYDQIKEQKTFQICKETVELNSYTIIDI